MSKAPIARQAVVWAAGISICLSATSRADPPAQADDLMKPLQAFADNLIQHARDKYGPKQTPLFVSQLEIATKRIPPAETELYGKGHRGGAGPTTNNLQFDSGAIRFLDAMTRLTGDPKYSQAVEDYLAFYLSELPDPRTGLFPWGDHRGYDLSKDETIAAVHEFKVVYPPWRRMYATNPQAVRKQIESLKLHIYDEAKSWAFNRHYPAFDPHPASMNSSAGAWIAAWSFLHNQTSDPKHLQWADTMADYLWSLRDPNTNLLAAHPADPAYPIDALPNAGEKLESYGGITLGELYRLRASRTEYLGQLIWYAPNLLQAARVLGPEQGDKLRRQALAYVHAVTGRMDVQPDGSFYATFELTTGKPLFPRISDAWKYTPQYDERYPWPNFVLGLRAPVAIAFAHKATGEPELKEAFDKLLPLYRINEFTDANGKRKDLPAGVVAQAIISFLDMHQATGDQRYLEAARVFGRYAMKHYYVRGWLVCGPPLLWRYQDPRIDTWNTYSNRGGSAELALALLRLHLAETGQENFVEDNPMSYF